MENRLTEAAQLVSLVLTLRPLPYDAGERPMPRWWGRAAHALLLKTIAGQDAALAETLHAQEGLKPLTASNLLGHFKSGSPDPAQTYALRFTAVQAPIAEILMHAAVGEDQLGPGARIELDYIPFPIEQAALSPEQHPWAAVTSFQDLFTAHFIPGNPPPRRISLHLASPTGFHSGGSTLPLPLPELVFGSLLERWNAFAPVALPNDLRRYARECLNISRFHLRSLGVPVKEGGLRVGAMGEVTYTSSNYDRYWMSLVDTLAAFAQFSGVGAGVSSGLGQCRKVEPAAVETDSV
jgi:CRISPR-associated endoribonuclease Cas6